MNLGSVERRQLVVESFANQDMCEGVLPRAIRELPGEFAPRRVRAVLAAAHRLIDLATLCENVDCDAFAEDCRLGEDRTGPLGEAGEPLMNRELQFTRKSQFAEIDVVPSVMSGNESRQLVDEQRVALRGLVKRASKALGTASYPKSRGSVSRRRLH